LRTAACVLVLGLAFVVATPVVSQERRLVAQGSPPTLEELDRSNVLEELQRMHVLVDKIVRDRRLQCIRAFGDPDFCDCLTTELPVGASFITYVQVVTSTRDALKSADLSKQLVDNIIATRERCVRRSHGGQRK